MRRISILLGVYATLQGPICGAVTLPPPPDPEPIEITELPLPPVAPSSAEGSCTPDVNPLGSGCILQTGGLKQLGSFLPDNNHVIAYVNFVGAPAAPDPASIYDGEQIIIIKADNKTFSDGSPWKCLTCGVPEDNTRGRTAASDYPQSFRDGNKLLVGDNILECGGYDLASDECTPERTFVYPIRWNTAVDGSGEGGALRELRLHPDSVHIGFNSFTVTTAGNLGQVVYVGRLIFNPSPTTGLPLSPRYEITNVTALYNGAPEYQPILVEGDKIRINPKEISVGEFRGFSGSGKEITYVGYPKESSNIDVFAVDLATGSVRRLTSHPEYCDPLDISADDEWIAIMDTRGSDRQMFLAGMRNIPPLTDQVTVTVTSSTRNNGQRRFFQPYLLDRYGDRGDYYGQQINGAGDGSPGSFNDPLWNGLADPRFSLDVTRLAYWQGLVVSPACGGINPLPCPSSTEPGGRTERALVAHFTERQPKAVQPVASMVENISWGTPYEPGLLLNSRPFPPGGTYTLDGLASGSAEVVFTETANGAALTSVAVTYRNFSDDGLTFLNGYENVTSHNPSVTLNVLDWYSDLVQSGETEATKKTSDDGFHITIDVQLNNFDANGTLTTTINGTEYKQPANGT
ncbi:putative saponin hydrolase precursor [Rosellinia necatrix]|uniref:Putative saponin hydrolase n=1 Tax=Rosellinia necatrix TaxID=77044 RepID=A0A1S7ULL1_ROSNE|nr:putative saponin hydrolase precursor [Rosellinia necatrix]